MNNLIDCHTTEEHNHIATTPEPSLSLSHGSAIPEPSLGHHSSSQQMGQPVPIVGVSGNTYAPMDTTPPTQDQNARVKMLMDMLTSTLTQLVKELQTPSQPQTDLEQAVDTALEQAHWFTERVNERVEECVEAYNFEYEIGQAVERELRNIDINDHCDINEMVHDAVSDRLEDVLEDMVQDKLSEMLANATIKVEL